MSLKCKIGLHSWDGCKCSECKKTRDEQHDWSKDCEECSKCGKIRYEQHDWSMDCEKCSKCGKLRVAQHDWNGCKCSKCGKIRDEQHEWVECNCFKCGVEQHVWIGDICQNCSKKRYLFNSLELIKAIKDNNIVFAEKLLNQGADPNSITKDGFCALDYVDNDNSLTCVKVLLEAGANPNLINLLADYVFRFYYSNKKEEIYKSIELLLKHGLDVNKIWEIPSSSRTNNEPIRENLLKVVTNEILNRERLRNYEEEAIKLIKLLLANGADPDFISNPKLVNWSILLTAIIKDRYSIVKVFLENGATILTDNETIFSINIEKCEYIKSEKMREILRRFSTSSDNEREKRIEYFQQELPSGNGRCSWDACPCGGFGSEIPRGKGYLYIPESAVEFRKDCLTYNEFQKKLQRMTNSLPFGSNLVFTDVPVLVCEKGIKDLNIDPFIAEEDATHWWNTGLIPLRSSPKCKKNNL